MENLLQHKAILYNQFIKNATFNNDRLAWDSMTKAIKYDLLAQWNQICKRNNRLGHINELRKEIDKDEIQFILSAKYGHTCEDSHIYQKLSIAYANGDVGHCNLLMIAETLYSECLTELQ